MTTAAAVPPKRLMVCANPRCGKVADNSEEFRPEPFTGALFHWRGDRPCGPVEGLLTPAAIVCELTDFGLPESGPRLRS